MADTYTKKADGLPAELDTIDAWKSAIVEKEHQPATVKLTMTYIELETKLASVDAQIMSLGEQKTEIEAEMVKVKTAVSGSN
jgi:hypothetical protein